jgi:tight adherence protein B
MEAFSMVLLALFLLLGLMFYERSRRAELKGQEQISRRIAGNNKSSTREPGSTTEKRGVQSGALAPESLRQLERWLAQAGFEMPGQQFLALSLVTGVAGLLLTWWLLDSAVIGFYCGLAFAASPATYVWVQRKRRLATFSQQLPHVADFLRSALRAGHPIARGLQMAAENAPEPTATELRLALEQMRYGASLADALDSMFKRVPEDSLGFFVAAIRVQAQVGSSLAEILDRVADAIRSRQRLQQQIKTLTAQARMSGLLVGAMPFFMLVVFSILRPEFTAELFHDPTGNKLLEAAIGMDLIALVIINRMLKI